MVNDKKFNTDGIILIGEAGEKTARNDGGELARRVAALAVEEKKQAALEAAKLAQKANSEQKEELEMPKSVTRQQRRQEAMALRKLADESESERAVLVKIIHKKAKLAGIPFQHFVQRMMDSGAENLVEMAKIIRRIK
jgi:hypothetical protein